MRRPLLTQSLEISRIPGVEDIRLSLDGARSQKSIDSAPPSIPNPAASRIPEIESAAPGAIRFSRSPIVEVSSSRESPAESCNSSCRV